MEVHLSDKAQAKLDQLCRDTGRRSDELVEDAVLGYYEDLVFTREMLDRRYDDLASGRVQPINGEAFFEDLRRREEELIEKSRRH